MNPNQISENQPVPDKIPFTIDIWKSKLIDLSKRNRALNFKTNKVSTVTIVGENIPEVFRYLSVEEKPLKFLTKPEPANAPAEPNDDENALPFDPDNFELSDEPEPDRFISSSNFESYEATGTTHRLSDGLLTNSTKDNLDKSLIRIEQRARLSIEEQGVNALFLALGMLRYNESKDSEVFYEAPLILIPVELSRRSARTGYTIKANDDEVIVNPSLAEYLKRQYDVILPDIPASNELADSYDLSIFLSAVSESVESQSDWSILDEIHLGLFSFQKLVMYKDLEANAQKLADHRIVRNIIMREEDSDFGLPAEIRDLDLDEEFPPECQRQIMDADSSQMRAIAAVARKNDLVLVGPPGTGKSQTITNLIANALSEGKKVLFVSEKMAALEVVHRRLLDTGIGEFCLELHSTKANKRSVMEELARTMDASLSNITASTEAAARLPEVRRHLNEYVGSVHRPFGILNKTPFRIFGEVEKVLTAPKAVLQNDIMAYTNDQIEEDLRNASDLAVVALEIGDPLKHPFRQSKKDYFSANALDEIELRAKGLISLLDKAILHIESIKSKFGMPAIETFADVEAASEVASVISNSPGAPVHVLESEEWNTPPDEASRLVVAVNDLMGRRMNIETKFHSTVFDSNPENDISFVKEKLSGRFSFLAFFDSHFRATRRKWNSYRLEAYSETLLEQAGDMELVAAYLEKSESLESEREKGKSYFGALWKGEDSDVGTLENYISWVVEFRKIVINHGLKGESFIVASSSTPDLTMVEDLVSIATEIRSGTKGLSELIEFDADYLEHKPLKAIKTRLIEIVENLNLAPQWAAFESKRSTVETGVLGELLPFAMGGEIEFADMGQTFKRAFYHQWLDAAISDRPSLRSFNSLTHEARVREFQTLDKAVLKENRKGLVNDLRNRLQAEMKTEEVRDSMPFLRNQLNRQRGLAPLRITLKHSLNAIRSIKPCFLMSPLTVAQLLDGETGKFDLVIFDEASQVPTEDAVGAIFRGEQLVVVGDPKQLPPTNFFAVQTGQVNAQIDDDGLPLFQDTESILEEVSGAGVPKTSLKWHYRSEHESLITFSNANFYDFDLYTFPSVESQSTELGLHFEYVENGVYEGRGLNMVEARRVADAVVDHIKRYPELSLGVGTFNMRQQIAIQDELELRRRNDPSIEEFFENDRPEPFFVKNLENIQGDERDVIFLSVTYGKEADGKIRYRLGPINGENGWRRLNVLTTRAKHRMRVFSSIRSDEMNLAATPSTGAQLLKSFLRYAEHGIVENERITALADTESPFERQVVEELQNRNYSVQPQVGVCGYRIDIGVLDESREGRYVCGIECDGVSYHSSETARDRDRTRQQVLEARGWDIHRIWSTDWFKDRNGQIERIVRLISESKEKWKFRDENMIDNARDPQSNPTSPSTFEVDITEDEIENLIDDSLNKDYVRPIAQIYKITPDDSTNDYELLIEAEASEVADAITRVVDCEAPLHFDDLTTRVAAFWGQKTGSIIVRRIKSCLDALMRQKRLIVRGEFVWDQEGKMLVRSREGTGIPIERIPPEEIRQTIALVLTSGATLSRDSITNEVRAVLGYSRTGPNIKSTIDNSIEELIEDGQIGESSFGLALRRNDN